MTYLMGFLMWAGLSFYVWPHLIAMTSGIATTFFILTWPFILSYLPLELALHLSGGLVKDVSKKLKSK
jgi:hypothetical protein